MSGEKLRIVAAICTYNRYDLLPAAIESCFDQDMDPDLFEIVVVDNSPDYEAAVEFGKKYIERGVNYIVVKTPGLSNARNVAARASTSDVIAYLDDDAVAYPGWLRELAAAYESFGSQAMVAGGRINPIWSVPRPDWLGDEKLGYLTVIDWGGVARVAREGEWIAGANISFRREPLLEFGGFDTALGRKGSEATLLSNEETDLVAKMTAGGGLVLYVPEATVDHLVDERRLHQSWFRRRAAWQAVSDSMNNPEVANWAPQAFDSAREYLLTQPPRYRSMSGLQREVHSPEEFNAQLDAVYNMTVAMLSGFRSVA